MDNLQIRSQKEKKKGQEISRGSFSPEKLTESEIARYLESWKEKIHGSEIIHERKEQIFKAINSSLSHKGAKVSKIVTLGLGQMSMPCLVADQKKDQLESFVQFGFIVNLGNLLHVQDENMHFFDASFSSQDLKAIRDKHCHAENKEWEGEDVEETALELTIYYCPNLNFRAIEKIIQVHRDKKLLHNVILIGQKPFISEFEEKLKMKIEEIEQRKNDEIEAANKTKDEKIYEVFELEVEKDEIMVTTNLDITKKLTLAAEVIQTKFDIQINAAKEKKEARNKAAIEKKW